MHSAIAAGMIAAALGGCTSPPAWNDAPECLPPPAPTAGTMAAGYANPIFIPVADPQCAWETIVSVVSAYFRIEREEPVRMVGNMLDRRQHHHLSRGQPDDLRALAARHRRSRAADREHVAVDASPGGGPRDSGPGRLLGRRGRCSRSLRTSLSRSTPRPAPPRSATTAP